MENSHIDKHLDQIKPNKLFMIVTFLNNQCPNTIIFGLQPTAHVKVQPLALHAKRFGHPNMYYKLSDG